MDSITKKCSKCYEIKQLDCFSTDNRSLDGKFTRCKECESERLKQYYKKNSEKIKNKVSEYSRSNFDKISFYNKNIRKKDKKSSAIYYEKNKDRILKNVKEWRKNNRDKRKLYNYRRRKTESVGSFTKDEWKDLCNKHNNKCLCCGMNNIKLTVDHVIPLCVGGTNNIDNLQPLCRSCNSKKGKKIIDYRGL